MHFSTQFEPTRQCCVPCDLQQCVQTKNFTDIPATKLKVGPYIADHRMLLATLPLPETQTLQISRQRFNVRKANWNALTNALVSADWSAIDRGTANDAVTYFVEFLWTILCTHIPYETVVIK